MPVAETIPTLKESTLRDETVLLGPEWGLKDASSQPGVAARFAEALGLPDRPRQRNVALVLDPDLAEEEYCLNLSAKEINVAAAKRSGFLRALSTLVELRDGPRLPLGAVRDFPRLKTRGIHLMYECFRRMRLKETLSLLDTASRLKLNTVLIELGDRFPFERHAVVSSESSLTRDEVKQIVAFAEARGIECIPLLQSLGHLNYLLRHDEYADVREEHERRHQMCPSNDKSFRLFTELAEEFLEVFDGCKRMHIGADETRELGVCERCAGRSKGELYAGHINKVCEWLSASGVTPILWDDMLCAHPDAMDALHESAAIMYWDYWTTSSPGPLLVARHDREGKRAIVCDERWFGEWRSELHSVTAETLDHFAGGVSLVKDLGPDFMAVYGIYLGADVPKFVRAFPYIEYYQDKGREVIGAPSCSGNRSMWYTLPPFPRHDENIKHFADRCIEAGTDGLITTAWYNRLPELLYHGMIVTAETTW